MEVILQENFPSLGYVGDKVSVKPGFARNYLIPRGVALELSGPNARLLAHRMAVINAKKAKLKAEAEAFCQKLTGVKLEFMLKTGDRGKSFGSVTTKEIFDELTKQGIEVNKKQVRLSDAIKKAGEYSVTIKLHAEVTASIPVKVSTEVVSSSSKDASSKAAKGGKKARASKKNTGEDLEASSEAQAETTAEAAPAVEDDETAGE